MIRAAFNAPISISRDKNASLNERMDPLHWFYIGCIRCPADIPRSLAFNTYGSEKVRHFRDVPCIDNPRLDTGKYGIVTDGIYISTGAINSAN